MRVNSYNDHLAYTFEIGEKFFTLGNKVSKGIGFDEIVEFCQVKYNGRDRLLYDVSDYQLLKDVLQGLTREDTIMILKRFLLLTNALHINDYLDIYALDVNFDRLYFDANNKTIKLIVLPIDKEVNYNDGYNWQYHFRSTVNIFLYNIYRGDEVSYTEIYNILFANNMTDYQIIDYLIDNAFTRRKAAVAATTDGQAKMLILQHQSELGNFLFRIGKGEHIIGKSPKMADFVIDSDAISRKHCTIVGDGMNYSVSDLGSSNGTRVNGYTLKPAEYHYISEGDMLELANIRFEVHIMG